MFGKNKQTKEEKIEVAIKTAGLEGLLGDKNVNLFDWVRLSRKGLGMQETGTILSGSEKQALRTIVSQNAHIRQQNDLIIQLLAQISKNTEIQLVAQIAKNTEKEEQNGQID